MEEATSNSLEKIAREPFWILVYGILLEDSPTNARTILRDLRMRWPLPIGISKSYRRDLREALLGTTSPEAVTILLRKLAEKWCALEMRIGDSALFQLKRDDLLTFPGVTENVLETWKKYVRKNHDFIM